MNCVRVSQREPRLLNLLNKPDSATAQSTSVCVSVLLEGHEWHLSQEGCNTSINWQGKSCVKAESSKQEWIQQSAGYLRGSIRSGRGWVSVQGQGAGPQNLRYSSCPRIGKIRWNCVAEQQRFGWQYQRRFPTSQDGPALTTSRYLSKILIPRLLWLWQRETSLSVFLSSPRKGRDLVFLT